jgi:hypothetical protein
MFVGNQATAETQNTPDGGGCVTQGASLSTATLTLKPGTKVLVG